MLIASKSYCDSFFKKVLDNTFEKKMFLNNLEETLTSGTNIYPTPFDFLPTLEELDTFIKKFHDEVFLNLIKIPIETLNEYDGNCYIETRNGITLTFYFNLESNTLTDIDIDFYM